MFDETAIVAALLLNRKMDDDLADRRAFYGPDAQPETEQPRRKRNLTPRFLRRKDANLA